MIRTILLCCVLLLGTFAISACLPEGSVVEFVDDEGSTIAKTTVSENGRCTEVTAPVTDIRSNSPIRITTPGSTPGETDVTIRYGEGCQESTSVDPPEL